MENYYVYIILIIRTEVVITGITTNLLSIGFTGKNPINTQHVYSPNQLLYLEKFDNYQSALNHEKVLKKNLSRWNLEVLEHSSKQMDLFYV